MNKTKQRIFKIFIAILIFNTLLFSVDQIIIEPGKVETELYDYVIVNYKTTTTLGYNYCRDIMYSEFDNFNDSLEGIYTGYKKYLDPLKDPSTDAYETDNGLQMSCEHSWPKSMGAGEEPQTSDMHFLFPSVQAVNASRSNDPFADIEDSQTNIWYRLDEKSYSIPTSNIDEYSEKKNDGDECFEPRESVKGNIARAMFYFYTIYHDVANEYFWDIQKETLLRWHYQDPVDQAEYNRTCAIAPYQDDKRNPFVLDSTLARRMWFYDPNATVSNFVFINEVDYDQPGTDSLEFIELVGKAGTDLTPYSLEFVNGLNGSNTISIGFNGKNIPVDLGLDTLDFFVIGSANVPNVDYTPAGMTSEAVDNADNYPAGIRLLKNGVVMDEISYEGSIASFTTGSALSVSEDNESPNQSIGRNNSSLDTILWDQDDEFTVAEPSPGLINTSHGQNDLVVKVEDDEYVIPEKYQLSIFPNPFNNELTIQIPIANAGDTKISIYNIQGRLVDKYNLQNMSKGMYEFHWNAQQLSSGLYIIRVDNMNKRYINKALLIK